MKSLIFKKILLLSFLIVLWISGVVFAEFQVKALPNVENPKKIILENDSLKMEINLDWQLSVLVLEYKPLGIQLIQPD